MPRARRSFLAPRFALLAPLVLLALAAPARATLVVVQLEGTYTSVQRFYNTTRPVVGDVTRFTVSYDTDKFPPRADLTVPVANHVLIGTFYENLYEIITVYNSPAGQGADRIVYRYESLLGGNSTSIRLELVDPTGEALSSVSLPTAEEWARFTQGTFRRESDRPIGGYIGSGPLTQLAPVPEPMTLAGAALGLALAAMAARRASGGRSSPTCRRSLPT